jgi:hypothetical protein
VCPGQNVAGVLGQRRRSRRRLFDTFRRLVILLLLRSLWFVGSVSRRRWRASSGSWRIIQLEMIRLGFYLRQFLYCLKLFSHISQNICAKYFYHFKIIINFNLKFNLFSLNI